MKALVACEYSGRVRDALSNKGWDAWSCDMLPTESELTIREGKHIQGDVLEILGEGWDLMIAFPPCTYLTVTANRSFLNNPERWKKRLEAVLFVYELMNAPIKHISIENPKGVISTHIRKPDQYIQPYQFGHPDSKMTGLWLKNLPLLCPTNIVDPIWIVSKSGKRMSETHWRNPSSNNKANSLLRSKTYAGIAEAMADQWTKYIIEYSNI